MTTSPDLSLQADAAPDLGAGPSYYRLDDAAWAQIAEQYRSGATAKTLSALWRVSAGTIYRHAIDGGWTKAKRSVEVSQVMVARERERLAFAERIAGEAEAAAAPREADPLEAARTLARRGAGSALKGRSEQARGELALAQDLARCARLLGQVQAELTAGAEADAAEAPQDEEEPAATPEEDAALNARIIAGLRRHARRRGRKPPQRLPLFCWLPGDEQYRPLAQALDVIDADDNAVCPDFAGAVAAAEAAGRGDAVRAALTTPLPLEACVWLSDEQKAALRAQEAGEGALAPAPPRVAAPDREPEAEAFEAAAVASEEAPAAAAAAPGVRGLQIADPLWRLLHMPERRGLAEPRHYVGGP